MLNRGQIWVETVLYTLLGISLMALVLAFAIPKITASQERAIVEQSIQSVQTLYDAIETVQTRGSGNVKGVEISVRAGSLTLDGINDSIMLILPEQKSKYSQPGSAIPRGALTILTEEISGRYKVTLRATFPRTNLTLEGKDLVKVLSGTSTAHHIRAEARSATNDKLEVSLTTS
jgi:type II secretory pathway pseudopilin PulG